MDRRIEFDFEEILINYEIEKLLNNIEKNSKITEIEVTIEREILSVAKSYDEGIYKKCDYMKPNDAYDCIRYSCEYENRKSILQYINDIECEIKKMICGDCYNKILIERYVKNILKFISNKSIKEHEFKKYGREYELFNF